MKIKILFSCLYLLAFYTQNMFAQQEETTKRKMTIVTKKVDENGKETVTTVVKEGDEISDEEIEQLIERANSEEGRNINVDVQVNDDKTKTITIKENGNKETTKRYKIIKKTQEIEIENGLNEEIDIEKPGKKTDIQKMDNKDVQVIKKGEDEMEKEIEVTVESDDQDEVIWIEKMDGEDGDIIIIEEETTTETDKDGKTTKTVKKTKKIIKKAN